MRCPACASPAPEGARFCPSCGHLLRAPADERRIVTVLFADLVGFTSLAEARDPEQVKRLVERCFGWLADDVVGHGGRVDNIVGDGLLAIFGAPVAHEDDAERAVRAALQMQRTLDRRRDELSDAVRMRIGVNTGEVLVGAVRAGGDVTAMGDAVNVASRLQSAATPGQVVVGPATYEATRTVVGYRPLGVVRARGRDEPVEAWEAVDVLAPPGHRPRRRDVPLVGRDPELALLRRAVALATERQRAAVVLLLGEAGVGKSRLAAEVAEAARCEHGAVVLEGRCIPYGEANAWWPVAEAVRTACGITADDDAATVTDKVRTALARAGADDAPLVEALRSVLGIEPSGEELDATRARDLATRAVGVLLDATAAERPLVVVLSELHWADELVLGVVDELLARLQHRPVVLLATARPELAERWAPQPRRHDTVTVCLAPLDAQATSDLATALLGDAPGEDLRSVLVERSGGNPFFLEELTALLGDARVVVPALTGRGPSGRGTGVDEVRLTRELPATLRGLVAARLDALPPEERAVLEDAAVAGGDTPRSALHALGASRGASPDEVDGAIEQLAGKDLLHPVRHTIRFRTEVVREVAYETLSKAERARRHVATADWFRAEARRTGREGEHLDRIAHHDGTAAEIVLELGAIEGVPDDLFARTHDAIHRAAARAENREQHKLALHLYDLAARLTVRPGSRTRRKVLVGRARTLVSLRDHARAVIDLEEALAVVDGRGADPDVEAQVQLIRGRMLQQEAQLAEAVEVLDDAIARATALGDDRLLAEAQRTRGMTAMFAGDLAGAEEFVSAALETARRAGHGRDEAWALQNLAWIAMTSGRYDEADQRLAMARVAFEELGDDGGIGWVLGMLAFVRGFQGRRAESGELAEQVLPTIERSGDGWAHAMLLTLLGGVRMWDGRVGDAIVLLRQAFDIAERLDDVDAAMLAGSSLSRALVASGALDDADAVVARLREVTGRRGTPPPQLPGLLATLHLDVGDVDAAREALGGGATALPVEHLARARLALLQGDAAGATALLEEATRTLGGGERTNAHALLALSAAGAARWDTARRAAVALEDLDGTTYRDRTLALLGRAFADAAGGDAAAALAAADEAWRVACDADDLLWQAVVALGRSALTDVMGEGGTSAGDPPAVARLGLPLSGYRVAFGTAAAAARSAARPA